MVVKMVLLLCLIFLIVIYFVFDEKKYKEYGVLISLLLIFSLFAFRNMVGIDDDNYRIYYDLIKFGSVETFFNISGVEYSYYLICKVFTILNFNYKAVFFFYSSIGFIFIEKTLNKFTLNKKQYFLFFLSFLAFSLVPFITVMRQFTATAIGIYVICDNKVNFKNIVLLILSFCLHNTSIIFLPILFISKLDFFNNKKIYILLPLLAIFLNVTGIFYWLIKIILKGTSYYRYVLEANITIFGGAGKVVITMFLAYLFNLIFLNNDIKNKNINILLFLQMIFFTLYFLCSGLGVLGRMYYFFIFFEPISLIMICTNLKKYNNIAYYLSSSFFIFLIIYELLIEFERFNIINYSINFWRWL